jgi:hypothetical protein
VNAAGGVRRFSQLVHAEPDVDRHRANDVRTSQDRLDPRGHTEGVTGTPAELTIDDAGRVSLPLGLLAEAGLDPGSRVIAFTDGDGRVTLRREEDAMRDLIERGTLH